MSDISIPFITAMGAQLTPSYLSPSTAPPPDTPLDWPSSAGAPPALARFT
jgi:hypothetical protein